MYYYKHLPEGSSIKCNSNTQKSYKIPPRITISCYLQSLRAKQEHFVTTNPSDTNISFKLQLCASSS